MLVHCIAMSNWLPNLDWKSFKCAVGPSWGQKISYKNVLANWLLACQWIKANFVARVRARSKKCLFFVACKLQIANCTFNGHSIRMKLTCKFLLNLDGLAMIGMLLHCCCKYNCTSAFDGFCIATNFRKIASYKQHLNFQQTFSPIGLEAKLNWILELASCKLRPKTRQQTGCFCACLHHFANNK